MLGATADLQIKKWPILNHNSSSALENQTLTFPKAKLPKMFKLHIFINNESLSRQVFPRAFVDNSRVSMWGAFWKRINCKYFMVPYSLVAKINEYLINHNWLTELFLLIRGATEQDFWMAGFRRDNVISQLVSCPATSKGCFFFFFEISIPCAWVQETNIGLLPPCLPFWDRSFFTFHNKRMIGFRGSCHRIEAGFCYKRRNPSRWDVAF